MCRQPLDVTYSPLQVESVQVLSRVALLFFVLGSNAFGAPAVDAMAPRPAGVLLEVGRGGSRAHEITARGYGLRLTLTVPRRVYPRNALVRVYIVARNITPHRVWILPTENFLPGDSFPQVDVLNGAGEALPPPLKLLFIPGLPIPLPRALKPAQSIGADPLVVLTGSWLRASIAAVPGYTGRGAFHLRFVRTRALRIFLVHGMAPRVVLNTGPGDITVDVSSPVPVRGPLYSIFSSSCHYNYSWTPTPPYLNPGCRSPARWYALAGWLNHPIASISYQRPP
jgi:hypothetical protein